MAALYRPAIATIRSAGAAADDLIAHRYLRIGPSTAAIGIVSAILLDAFYGVGSPRAVSDGMAQ